MKFIVEESFWNLFPQASIAVMSLDIAEDKKLDIEEEKAIESLLREANLKAKKYLTSEVISENEVVKVWRNAYASFKTKKGARCSLENLLKRVLHDNPVGSIAPSVDITNAISLTYAFPIGAEDLDKIQGDLHLGMMKGGEDFLPIGSDIQDPPYLGEIGYYDDYGCVCRCFNWRDGQRTEISDNTHREFIAMECLEEDRLADLENALNDLSMLFEKYLNAKIYYKTIVNINNPITDL